ncbi:MAG: hypothetical protein LBH43_19900 [Treponema sp.]|jgi:hypothetical protein|nr:hypothetical protein [Treponema sp.]
MEEQNKSKEDLIFLKEKYIRIIYLLPMTIAEVKFFGETLLPGEDAYLANEENKESCFPNIGKTLPNHFVAGLNAVDKLIIDKELMKVKPDFRLFGFSFMGEFANDPSMKIYGPFYGFCRWLSIPENIEVPFPIIKKQFNGGLYCAFNCGLNNDYEQEWDVLNHFVTSNEKYQFDFGRDPDCNYGILEEYLNYINLYNFPQKEKPHIQTDLIMPIKERYS